MNGIVLENVSKSYNRRSANLPVLHEVCLEIRSGELALVEGPSGSGKTTLLNIIGAMVRATCGRVVVMGEVLSASPESFLSRFRGEKIGFIFQGFHLIERLTVEENVVLPLLPLGLPPRDRQARGRQMLERFGLLDRAAFRACDLSGGERQRVAIARALIANPPIIIADEPICSIDQESAAVVLQELEAAREAGRTVIVAAHAPMPGMRHSPDLVVRLARGVVELIRA